MLKNRKINKFTGNIGIVALGFVFLFCSCPLKAEEKKIRVFNSFDEIKNLLVPGGDTTLFINFWASWCKPCIQEMPAIEQARKEFTGKKIKFLLVSLDDPSKIDRSLLPLIEKLNINSEVVLLNDTDYNNWIDKVDPSWSGAIPGTLIINGHGRAFYEKSFTREELTQIIYKHLTH